MKHGSVVAVALMLAACSPPAAQAPAADTSVIETAAPAAQASEIPLTREFLVGAWGDNGDCNAVSTFNADGTYEIGGAPGTWMLEGDVITMQGAGGTFQVRAQVLNQNQVLIGNPDGSVGISQRC